MVPAQVEHAVALHIARAVVDNAAHGFAVEAAFAICEGGDKSTE